MTVPMIDLVAQYRTIEAEIDGAIKHVLESGQFILGPEVGKLEAEAGEYLGVRHAVGLASGTDALIIGYRAIGLGPGDEVIMPTYTFYATAEAAMLIGATPVFVDIEPDTYCLDISQVRSRITTRTKAVVAVHLYGHPADMGPLKQLADERGLKLVEDAAQAFGAEYQGRRVGGLGDVGCISFYPSKNLGAYGDAGLLVTNDDMIAEHACILRMHGWREKYRPQLVGYNSRLDELQAAILRVKLRHLDDWNARRQELASAFRERLQPLGVKLPSARSGVKHVYHQYMIEVLDRDHVQRMLADAGVASAQYYPLPLHLTEACKRYSPNEQTEFPVSEAASQNTLAIPFFPEMTIEQVDEVRSALRTALRATVPA